MPNFGEHLFGGIVFSVVAFIVFGNDFGFGEFLVAVGLSGVGSMIPDALEPPTFWDHRSFFHSFVVLAIGGLLTLTLLESIRGFGIGAFVGFIAIGYLSHLILDAFTDTSLPLIA